MLIQILGMGCPNCHKMVVDVERIVSRLGIPAKIEHISDQNTIIQHGVFVLPALVIDGKVVTAGYSGQRRIEKVISESLGG